MPFRPNRPPATVLHVVLPAVLLVALQGCSTTPRFNKDFGTAARSNLAAQVINPAAATNANPAIGIDGAAARTAIESYQRSFKEPAPAAQQSLIGGNGAR